MNIQQYLKLTLAAALIGGFSAQAQANSCYDQSPLSKKLGDDYAQLTYSPADAAGAGKLSEESLIEMIDTTSLRSGSGVRYNCLGAGNIRSVNPIKFELDDIERVQTARGNIHLTAWEESRRKVKSAVIDLPEASKWISKSRDEFSTTYVFRRRNGLINDLFDATGREDYSKFLTRLERYDRGLDRKPYDPEFLERARRGTHLAELSTNIKRSGRGLTITQTLYINGLTAGWVTWELDG